MAHFILQKINNNQNNVHLHIATWYSTYFSSNLKSPIKIISFLGYIKTTTKNVHALPTIKTIVLFTIRYAVITSNETNWVRHTSS